MIKEHLHLTAEKMGSIDPISYSVTFQSEMHKQYWSVSVMGERQAFLVDSMGNPVKFETENEAVIYCTKLWPEIQKI
jgi:hypothetical protein